MRTNKNKIYLFAFILLVSSNTFAQGPPPPPPPPGLPIDNGIYILIGTALLYGFKCIYSHRATIQR